MSKKLFKYFKGDDLASSVWQGKYALEGEETPDDMHRRMAKEFIKVEEAYISKEESNNDLSTYGRSRSPLTEEKIYSLLKDFKYICPQGSIMSQLGNNKDFGSLSNCFVVGQPEDSYGGIFQKDEELAQLMKRRGGVGIDISTLRPSGTPTSNAAKSSTGAVSFMERFSNTTREVAQNGRRGALMISIDIRHPDVMDFIKIKEDLSKVTGANISVMVRDDFMEAVKNDKDYILRFPCTIPVENIFNQVMDFSYAGFTDFDYGKLYRMENAIDGKFSFKKIKAKEYWEALISAAHKSAEPGIIFIDKHWNYSPDGVYEQYRGVTTNPCVSGDTPILTDKGYYPIESLVGIQVNIWNGEQWSLVEPKITGEDQKMLEISLSDGRTIKCTNYHSWYIRSGSTRDGVTNMKEARQLCIGDKIEKYNLPIAEYGYDAKNRKFAYTQGFYSGDGVKDTSIIWLYDEKIKLIPYLEGEIKGKTLTTVTGAIRKTFKITNAVFPKSWTPTNCWSVASRLDWLAGLIDSDGCSTTEGGLQIWSIDKKFLLDVQLLLTTLGVNSKVVDGKGECMKMLPDGKGSEDLYHCKESYRILVNSTSMQSLLNLGLKTYRVLFEHFKPSRDASRYVTITSIKQIENADFVYCFNEPLQHKGIFNGVLLGNCGEIFMQPYDACRLIALNLFSFVENPFTKDAKVNYELLYQYAYEQQRLADDIIDLEIEKINNIITRIATSPESVSTKRREVNLWENIKHVAASGRRTGCGFTALGDMLAALGLKYDSSEALEVIDRVMYIKMKGELDCTIDLAILRNPFDGWNSTIETTFIEDNGPIEIGANYFYTFLSANYPDQWERMKEFGRRNVSWSTVAPTGSLSILTQTTSGLEPLFAPYYMRRKKVNPGDEGVRIDFTDQNGDTWQEYPVLHPKFKDWLNSKYYARLQLLKATENRDIDDLTKDELSEAFEESPWYQSTANDIDWIKRVEIQSIIQDYTTHSISSTINLPNTVSVEEVMDIYEESWNKGLKGVTVYRDGSRSGVLVTEDSKKQVNFDYVDSPKRPKELDAHYYYATSNGRKYAVIIGLLEEKPYEVFAFEDPISKDYLEGKIVKIKKGVYKFISPNYTIDNLQLSSEYSDEKLLTRFVSSLLRHGVHPKYVIEQTEKSEIEITAFAKVVCRVLKKYIPDGEKSTYSCDKCGSDAVIFEEGCRSCKSCGESKCG